jgi:hypothetical protein
LRNPRLIGQRTYHGEVVAEDAWPAILERATYDRLQAKICRGTRPGRTAKQLLSGVARCGRCDAPMWASIQKNGETRTPRYCCIKRPGAPGCGATTIVAGPLDELITEAVVHRLGTKAMVKALKRQPDKKVAKTDIDLAQIDRDLEALAEDHGAGRITRREWLAAKTPLDKRRAEAIKQIDLTTGTVALAPFEGNDVRVVWDKLHTDRKRNVLDVLIERIVINPAARPGQRFSPDRVDVVWKS